MVRDRSAIAHIFRRVCLAAFVALAGYWASPRVAPVAEANISRPAPQAPPPKARSDSVAVRRDHLPGPYGVEVLRIVDGDTIEARVRIWLGQEITTLVRLRGIDAPELKARCGRELRGAEASRDALARLLVIGAVNIEDVALDKFGGRVVASVFVDQPNGAAPLDVSEAMRQSGMARTYAGGKRDNWCPLAPAARD